MKRVHYAVTIRAPRAEVWKTMLERDSYRVWTAAFTEGSYYEGSWAERERIRFLSPGGSGIVAEVAEYRPNEFVSLRHLGLVKDGVEDFTSDEVRKWTPAFENYTLHETPGGTDLRVDMDLLPEHEAEMSPMWERALAKLKALCEGGAVVASASPWAVAVHGQYGGALQMMENAIRACPDERWGDTPEWHGFGYLAFHTLFWLDLYLFGAVEGFAPPAPFGLEELDPEGKLPPRTYTKGELLGYLEHARSRCREVMSTMTDAEAARPVTFRNHVPDRGELALYNLRHLQHHVGQLQLLLRQYGVEPPRWVKRGADDLH